MQLKITNGMQSSESSSKEMSLIQSNIILYRDDFQYSVTYTTLIHCVQY